MKYISSLICLLILSTSFNYAVKFLEIFEPLKAPSILVDEEKIYIYDLIIKKFCIYHKKTKKKIAEFGKKGEGPGEFMGISNVCLHKDSICISSFPRIVMYSKEGRYLKELRSHDAGTFTPIGDKFIGVKYPFVDPRREQIKKIFSLYNSNLHEIKELFCAEFRRFIKFTRPKRRVLWIRDCVKAVTSNDRVVIGSTGKGYYFWVYSSNEDKHYEIKREYEKRPVTEEERRRIIDEAKRGMGEEKWERYRSRTIITFPDFYPAYANFTVADQIIYVFKFPCNGKQVIDILNLEGNMINRKIIDRREAIEAERFSIHNGVLYYLNENESSGNWEIHMKNINH